MQFAGGRCAFTFLTYYFYLTNNKMGELRSGLGLIHREQQRQPKNLDLRTPKRLH